MNLTERERAVLTALQRGIAPVERPFRGLPLPEDEVVALLRRSLESGLARRFGGVFDARRLGYRSVLCALDVETERMEAMAASIVRHPGVTHCYERRPLAGGRSLPALWFTFALPEAAFEDELAALGARLEPGRLLRLPALRRFKIDVVFDLRTRDRDEAVPGGDAPAGGHGAPPEKTERLTLEEAERLTLVEAERLTLEDRALVRLLDGDVPIVARPFDAVARRLGVPLATLLARLDHWRDTGMLRRVALILHHREAGFKANGMCIWTVDGDIVAAGRRVAARPEITHCYQRPRLPGWPFDLYAMIHTPTPAATQALMRSITADCGLPPGELLLSWREFKKTSMRYFAEAPAG